MVSKCLSKAGDVDAVIHPSGQCLSGMPIFNYDFISVTEVHSLQLAVLRLS
jgi:hypothetical protein